MGEDLNYSPRLLGYIEEVEEKTGLKVEISPFEDAVIDDLYEGEILLGPSVDSVRIKYRPLVKVVNPRIEKIIAHELTHALMIYYEGFHIPTASQNVPAYHIQTAANVLNLIDNVIVDTRIQAKGLYPENLDTLEDFVTNLRILEKASKRDEIDPYEKDSKRAEIKLVSSFIYAWALPIYANLSKEQEHLLKRYTDRFPNVMKQEYTVAQKVQGLFQTNDIFSVTGRTAVVIGALELWGFGEEITLAPMV